MYRWWRASRSSRSRRRRFVPLAERLGIWYFKTELETLAFAISSPRDFENVTATLASMRTTAEPALAAAQAEIRRALRADKVLYKHVARVEVRSRVKDAYSVWRKMQRKRLSSVDEVGDVLAFRLVLTPTAQGLKQTYPASTSPPSATVRSRSHRVLPMALRPAGGASALPIRTMCTRPGQRVRVAALEGARGRRAGG